MSTSRRLLVGVVAMLGICGCAKKGAETASPEAVTEADGAAAPALAGTADQAEAADPRLSDLEARLATYEQELNLAARDGDDVDGRAVADGETRDDAAAGLTERKVGKDRCDHLCSLADAICDLEDKICELADEHEGDARYTAVCERAEQDCERATKACDGCTP